MTGALDRGIFRSVSGTIRDSISLPCGAPRGRALTASVPNVYSTKRSEDSAGSILIWASLFLRCSRGVIQSATYPLNRSKLGAAFIDGLSKALLAISGLPEARCSSQLLGLSSYRR